MSKYLKKFETTSAYTTYIGGNDKVLPNVSYVTDQNEVHYNPIEPPLPNNIIKYEASAKLTETTNRYIGGLHTDAFNTTIKSHTFENGAGTIEFNDDVTSIGGYAFRSCSGMTSITIPNSVTSIGESAFNQCSGLTSIDIPNNITTIGVYAFRDCSSLTSITIPNSVTSIGNGAFLNCIGLTSVTIGSGVTSIGDSAFIGCSGLTSIEIPNSVTSIGSSAFKGCFQLGNLELPKHLEQIKQLAFSGCSSLESITIPATVDYIYPQAFSGCSSLKSVSIYAEEPPFLAENSFSNYNIPLYVPDASVGLYQTTSPWSNFKEIKPLSGTELEQCAKPTITMADGKLLFSSETEGATFVYHLTTPSDVDGEGQTMELPTSYTLSVYAKKEGYKNSETVTTTFDICGLKGDVDGNNTVDAADLTKLIEILLKR